MRTVTEKRTSKNDGEIFWLSSTVFISMHFNQKVVYYDLMTRPKNDDCLFIARKKKEQIMQRSWQIFGGKI